MGVVLGIVALAGHSPLVLSLVALLLFGAGLLLTGTSFGTTLASAFGA